MKMHPHNSLEEAVAALDSGPMEARNEPHSYRRSIFRSIFRIEYGPIHVVWRRGGVVSDMTIKEARRLDTLDQMSIKSAMHAVCDPRGIVINEGPSKEEVDRVLAAIEAA